jgi:hypothetical protein
LKLLILVSASALVGSLTFLNRLLVLALKLVPT